MALSDLDIKSEYRSLRDQVVVDFYIPILETAILYERAVGFFSSSALIEVSKGITGIIKNDGLIKLIVSPYLSEEDVKAINKGYELREQLIVDTILKYFTEPRNLFEEERLNILANLIESKRLDIKIAFTMNNSKFGLFHEKMGIVTDKIGNVVAFSGSMNDSATAYLDNYESIDVFCSWKTKFEGNKVIDKCKAFNSLWTNSELNLSVIDFPEVASEKLRSYRRRGINLNIDNEQYIYMKKMNKQIVRESIPVTRNTPSMPNDLDLYAYQVEAINKWADKGYKGIFDMATGTGKTYTGLGGLVKLFERCEGNLAVIIVCPYQHLVEQWVEDILKFNIDPIIGYSNSSQRNYLKKLKNAVLDYKIGAVKFFCFACTNATFNLDYIQDELTQLKGNVLLIVDEAHYFGAMQLSQTLIDVYNYRLALSATLERHNDIEGTHKLINYFGDKCIEYNLERAIDEGKLTPYYYYPHVVTLTHEELEKYNYYSNEMAKCFLKGTNGQYGLSEKGKKIAIKRARLVAGAIEKIGLLLEIIEPYKNDRHILVYCGATKLLDQYSADYEDDLDDVRQIDIITNKLWEKYKMKVSQFTSKEDSKERMILKEAFSEGDNLQALIAIKCLDEGVNIPNIRTAFILASTTNPKEYIQRRGRVLRLAKGKDEAIIHDFITLPRPLDMVNSLTKDQIRKDIALVKNELSRIIEFKRIAQNPMDGDKLIKEITEAYQLDKLNLTDNTMNDIDG